MKKWIFLYLLIAVMVALPMIFIIGWEPSHKTGMEVIELYYKEHGADTGTVHDPDCPCFKAK